MKSLKLHPDVWDKPATSEDVKDMKKDLSKWGIGFIVCGTILIISFFNAGSKWEYSVTAYLIVSGIVVGIGILMNLLKKRVMYLIAGGTLVTLGVERFFFYMLDISAMSVGIFLFILGVNQIKKYKLYKTE